LVLVEHLALSRAALVQMGLTLFSVRLLVLAAVVERATLTLVMQGLMAHQAAQVAAVPFGLQTHLPQQAGREQRIKDLKAATLVTAGLIMLLAKVVVLAGQVLISLAFQVTARVALVVQDSTPALQALRFCVQKAAAHTSTLATPQELQTQAMAAAVKQL
jgi:hypothetical protein